MLTGLLDSPGYLTQPLCNLALVSSHLPMLGQACIQLVLKIMAPLGKQGPVISASESN